MKKLFCVLLSLGISLAYVNAQTTAGSIMLGGGITFESTSVSGADTNESEFTFSPSAGYFLMDNFAVGLNLTIGSIKEEAGGLDEKTSIFGIGPFARYYIFTNNEKFAFYGQASFSIGSRKYDPGVGNDIKSGSFDFRVSPGFSYFFNEHWALDLGFRGIGITTEDPNKDVDNNERTTFFFGLNSLAPNFGVRFFLN